MGHGQEPTTANAVELVCSMWPPAASSPVMRRSYEVPASASVVVSAAR
ncbi:hypothetical protein [Pengzhenrongella sp.]